MNTIFERPTLNRPTPQQNLAVVDRWIADTVDKLNYLFGADTNEIEGQIPTALADLTDDPTHRLVTDMEKSSWNSKADRTKAYLTNDNASTDVDDADCFPFYDTSASVKKKSTWSNIKSVLKTYFDTLYAAITHTHTKSEITDFPTLATVATSGSYNDLSNKPTIPAAQVNSDWNASSGVAQILNKPTIPAEQIQSDWNQTTTTAKDYIKNKPTIPAEQIQSDWSQTTTTEKDYIKNKPTVTNVTQTASSGNANYEVLFSVTADNTTRTESVRKASNLTFNPSTGNLKATQLNGVTIGNSPKFTDTVNNGFTVAQVKSGTYATFNHLDTKDITFDLTTVSSDIRNAYRPMFLVYGGQSKSGYLLPYKVSVSLSADATSGTLSVKNMHSTNDYTSVQFYAYVIYRHL